MLNIQALATLALSLCCIGARPAAKDDAPPGLVLVRGGQTYIGSDFDELLPFLAEDDNLLGPLAPETPMHRVKVDDFYLMRTEVTNEQYAAYVQATGARPPLHWAPPERLQEGRMAFLEEQGRAIEEAKAAGEPVPERKKFDEIAWYRDHWKEVGFEVPKGQATHPVVRVDYQDAKAYARWAGLRLMTEAEYQRAVRGNGKDWYTWGPEWDPSKAANRDSPGNHSFPVGSFPAGANAQGIQDLGGNVWEWTSSPFEPYPKWHVHELKVGSGRNAQTKHGLVDWDANQRVVVGGAYATSGIAIRCTTRRPTERTQATEALGFRCASTVEPGRDMAETVLAEDLPVEVRPPGISYDAAHATATDRWSWEKGQSEVEGYAVITGYDYVMFLPVEAGVVTASTRANLQRAANAAGVQHLGVLAMTQPSIVPDLAAGTYLVALRAAGEGPASAPAPEGQEPAEGEEEKAAIPDYEWPADLDKNKDNFVFLDLEGGVAGFLPVSELEYGRSRRGTLMIGDSTRPVESVDEEGNPIVVEEPVDQCLMQLFVAGSGKKGWQFELPIKFEKGRLGDDWRRPR